MIEEIDAGKSIVLRDMNLDDMDALIDRLGDRIVKTSSMKYTVAMHKDDPTDCSDRTEYFDWHSDGLYHPVPPKYVLLHCLDPGEGHVTTELAEIDVVLRKMSKVSWEILARLQSTYIGHGGSFSHSIITGDGLLLASRGYASPIQTELEGMPSIRETRTALTELYDALDEAAIIYDWRRGMTLIFDQRKYLHRRRNDGAIDRQRKLLRMWFN